MTDHQWLVLEHLGTAITLITTICGFFIWFARWGKHIFKRWVREAVREEMYPVASKVEEMYPWFQVVSKAFGGKTNGKAANA